MPTITPTTMNAIRRDPPNAYANPKRISAPITHILGDIVLALFLIFSASACPAPVAYVIRREARRGAQGRTWPSPTIVHL